MQINPFRSYAPVKQTPPALTCNAMLAVRGCRGHVQPVEQSVARGRLVAGRPMVHPMALLLHMLGLRHGGDQRQQHGQRQPHLAVVAL